MKINSYSEMSDEKLLNQKKLFKGIAIGIGIVIIFTTILISYMGLSPLYIIFLVATFMPLLLGINQINKELNKRNLK